SYLGTGGHQLTSKGIDFIVTKAKPNRDLPFAVIHPFVLWQRRHRKINHSHALLGGSISSWAARPRGWPCSTFILHHARHIPKRESTAYCRNQHSQNTGNPSPRAPLFPGLFLIRIRRARQ